VKYGYYEGTRALQHATAFAKQCKMFSYSRETALGGGRGALVLAKSGIL